MIHAMHMLGQRHSETWMNVQDQVSASLYENHTGDIYAMVWNASDQSESIEFFDASGLVFETTVDGLSFTKIKIN